MFISAPRTHTLIPWLLLGVIALIAYGSLYPFNFKPDAVEGGLLQALDRLSWARAGRGDLIANVLLYLPFGFCLCLWLNKHVRPRAALLGVVLLGALLSLLIEVAQVYVSPRVPSLVDLSLNTLGALLGAVIGLAWRTMGEWMHLPLHPERPERNPGAALLIVLWLAWRFAPFVPLFDLAKLKAALRPLFDPQIEATTTFIYLAYWLTVSHAVSTLVSSARALETLLLLIAVVLVGRLVVANQSFVPSELLALLLMLPLLVLMMRLAPRPRRILVLGMLSVAFVVERLAPFEFAGPATAFDFWPFYPWWDDLPNALHGVDLTAVFNQLFLFGALLWVINQSGASMNIAALLMFATVSITEVLRLWLTGAHASIVAPLLAGLVAIAFRYVYKQEQRRAAFDGSTPRRVRNL